MKFDVIIGNPPYQEMTGGGQTGAKQIYHHFVIQALSLTDKYVSMITPSRWLFDEGTMEKFREDLIGKGYIHSIYDFEKSTDIFPTVEIAGGVSYYLLDKTKTSKLVNIINSNENKSIRELNTYIDPETNRPKFIRDNNAVNIVNKVLIHGEKPLYSSVSEQNPFDIKNDNITKERIPAVDVFDIEVIQSYGKIGYINEKYIGSNRNIINKYKVITGRVSPDRGGVNNAPDYNVINKPMILKPGQICSMTYLVLASFDTLEQAENMMAYIKTKLARFLILQSIYSISATRKVYKLIPTQDFNVRWDDNKLYKKYGLTDSEIQYVESKIKYME